MYEGGAGGPKTFAADSGKQRVVLGMLSGQNQLEQQRRQAELQVRKPLGAQDRLKMQQRRAVSVDDASKKRSEAERRASEQLELQAKLARRRKQQGESGDLDTSLVDKVSNQKGNEPMTMIESNEEGTGDVVGLCDSDKKIVPRDCASLTWLEQPYWAIVGSGTRLPSRAGDEQTYLKDLQPGQWLWVQYVGEGENIGWSYGATESGDHEGWFPSDAVIRQDEHAGREAKVSNPKGPMPISSVDTEKQLSFCSVDTAFSEENKTDSLIRSKGMKSTASLEHIALVGSQSVPNDTAVAALQKDVGFRRKCEAEYRALTARPSCCENFIELHSRSQQWTHPWAVRGGLEVAPCLLVAETPRFQNASSIQMAVRCSQVPPYRYITKETQPWYHPWTMGYVLVQKPEYRHACASSTHVMVKRKRDTEPCIEEIEWARSRMRRRLEIDSYQMHIQGKPRYAIPQAYIASNERYSRLSWAPRAGDLQFEHARISQYFPQPISSFRFGLMPRGYM